MTKTCVSELAWNKYGSDYIAVGTTSGYVLVYDVGSSSTKNLLLAKGHDGTIYFISRKHQKCYMGASISI
jgi:WD40 repeat protein